MSGRSTPATAALDRARVSYVVHEYDAGAPVPAPGPTSGGPRDRRVGYGERTVAALGVDPARVFKTLVAAVDGRLVAGIVSVDRELDLKALAAAVGGRRAEMADPAAAERSSGYVVGGISPFGQKRPLPTVVDEGALSHPAVLVSGGRRGLQVEVAPADLVRLTRATVAPIAR